jgi:hypothetical protein
MGEAKRRREIDPNYGKSLMDTKLVVEPDYSDLVDLFLSQGSGALSRAILTWLAETEQSNNSSCAFHQIATTVYEIAAKQVQALSSHELKIARFKLDVPLQPEDFGSYQSILKTPKLAKEGMRLINTGFFDPAINTLINYNRDAVSTLRRHGIILYMGVNDELKIVDSACALASWQPFAITQYVGEQRNSLNKLIEKTFQPLSDKIQRYRIEQKGADKFPCLSLLCLVEDKISGSVCEFRRHYTAQGGAQLIIPGFSETLGDSAIRLSPGMNILGKPLNIPSIRGFY